MDFRFETNRIQLRLARELNVLELSQKCPYDHCNPSFCPLHSLREKDVNDRIDWIHALSDDDLEYLSGYHQVCMYWRSANDSFTSPAPISF